MDLECHRSIKMYLKDWFLFIQNSGDQMLNIFYGSKVQTITEFE